MRAFGCCVAYMVATFALTASAQESEQSPVCNDAADDDASKSPRKPSLDIRQALRLKNITFAEYKAKFSRSIVQVPTIIEGANADWFEAAEWTRDAIRKECGASHLTVQEDDCRGQAGADDWDCHRVRYINPDLVGERWAAVDMVDLRDYDLETVADLMDAQETDAGHHLQLNDGSLHDLCPRLYDKIKIPKYIEHDYRNVKTHPDDIGWTIEGEPSLFISKASTGSALHTDTLMERVYVMGLSGRKLWRIFPPSEYRKLYPNLESFDKMGASDDSSYPTYFYVDAINPDFEKFPLLDGAQAYDAVLGPGDTLIMPPGWAHQILNLDDTIAAAGNFVEFDGLAPYNEFWRIQTGDYDVEERNEWLMHTAFFLPLDPIPRAREGDNVAVPDYWKHHHLQTMPVPASVKKWTKARSVDRIDQYVGLAGNPAITLAVKVNFVSVVKYLVEEVGASPNVFDSGQYFPLDWAYELSENGEISREIYDVLKAHGAQHSPRFLYETDMVHEEQEA